jgi:hypothetical protein
VDFLCGICDYKLSIEKTFNREVHEGIAKIAKKNKFGIFGAS